MYKTTFIVDQMADLEKRKLIEDKLVEVLKEANFEYEILSLSSPGAFEHHDSIKPVYMPSTLEKVRRLNIVRQYVSGDSKSLVFVNTTDFDLEIIRYRLELFKADPTVGIVGKFTKLIPFDKKATWIALSKEIYAPEDVYNEKCFDEKAGGTPIIVHDSLWTTQVVTWDKVGGMSLKSKRPFLEYQFRTLLLDYKIITE